jgi:hypothetical protein
VLFRTHQIRWKLPPDSDGKSVGFTWFSILRLNVETKTWLPAEILARAEKNCWSFHYVENSLYSPTQGRGRKFSFQRKIQDKRSFWQVYYYDIWHVDLAASQLVIYLDWAQHEPVLDSTTHSKLPWLTRCWTLAAFDLDLKLSQGMPQFDFQFLHARTDRGILHCSTHNTFGYTRSRDVFICT